MVLRRRVPLETYRGEVEGGRVNNSAAIGYMILAARMNGLNKLQIEIMEELMEIVLDRHTEEEAEEVYRRS
jgi:hypothetical protein